MLINIPKNKSCAKEKGIAYVVLLIYLTIMTCLGLSFIHRVGSEARIVMNKTISSQAHYLAESAASHAMWGMLNVPGFAPNGNMYYMHSFANGRYGYKVRKPTETTFATIAAIGAIGESVVEQGYVPYILPSNVYTAYGSSSNGVPFYRRLIGADWNAPSDVLLGGGSVPQWVELEGCPVRNELICGVVDSIGEIKVAVYDGTTWGNAQPFGHGDQNYKCFDIAYESQSGDALVVARDGTDTPLYFNIWDGTGWVYGNPQTAVTLAGGNIHDVVMASQPGGDEILIGVVTSWGEIQLVRWDGSAFGDLGTIETTAATNDFRKVEIVYEHQSGDAMVVWSRNSDSALKYRMWNGVALGPEGDLPDFGGNENYVIRGAADSDPTSDYIVIGAVDNFYDLSVAIWDGDNWIDSREVDIATATNISLNFDVAWEAAGEDAVIAWAPWSATNVRSIAWKKGTNLADCVIQEGPSLQTQGWLVRLLPISGTEKIVLLGETTSNVLRYCLWTGDKFRGDPTVLIESNVPVQNDVAFDLAEANVPRTGGTGSLVNLPPTVEAGFDQTVCPPGMMAYLDGTVSDDGQPDPPNTVSTTWSKVSGPGTVTFDDDSLVDTRAVFSAAGEYVLRLTADDSDLSANDEITIIVAGELLMVVRVDPANLTTQELARKTIFESWGYMVVPIAGTDTQTNFDAAVATADVAYTSEEVLSADVNTKLKNAGIGVVNEDSGLFDEFGFSSGSGIYTSSTIDITDNTHYITFPFGSGSLTLVTAAQELVAATGTMGGGIQVLGERPSTSEATLFILETGAALFGGGSAAGRRVQLPWGGSSFDVNALNPDGKTIMKRAIEWAAGCGDGIGCNANYLPDTKIGEFSTSTYGSGGIQGLAFLPEGTILSTATVPAGGALLSVDVTSDMFYLTDLSGNPFVSLPTGSGTHTGVTLVQSGPWANHIAVSDKFNDEIKYFDLTGSFVSSFSTNVSADFDGTTPEDVAFIGITAGGVYDNHLAIPDYGRNKVYLVDQNGSWVSSIDISSLTNQATGAVHLPGTDMLIIVDLNGRAYIIGFAGNLLNQYDTTTFGTDSPGAVTINPLTCNHLIGDDSPDLVVTLSLSGGGSDTDPPTPDPMTWASPPAPAGPTSITMTATTATDPSGVMYYFECTAGGCNDSGWIDTPTYVDTGLTPDTSYTYRVKATDKASPPNETGWSSEESATTDTTPEMFVNDIAMGFRTQGPKYFGQATVWIKDDGGADVEGALVDGVWLGAVNEGAMGTTGSDGRIFFESSWVNGGGTYIFTVIDVTKSGYVYNPALNVMTSNSITAP